MYRIEIYEDKKSKIGMDYTIGANLVIFTRETLNEVTGEPERFDVGISINDLIKLTETMKVRTHEYSIGVEPPEIEQPAKKGGYGSWNE